MRLDVIFIKISILLIVLCNIGCQTNDKDVNFSISISHYYQEGDRQSHILVGTNKKEIEQMYKRDDIQLPIFEVRKHVVKSNSIKYLKKFFENNCNPDKNIINGRSDYFIIRIMQEEQTSYCFLSDSVSSKLFFAALRKWISRAPERDVDSILKSLDL